MRKLLLGFIVVALISVFFYLRFRHPKAPPVETAYAGNRQVSLWNSTAQIRSIVATANFGDRLDILSRYGDEVQVRTPNGVVGWASAGDLLSAEFWQKAVDLEQKTGSMAVEAHGHTRVLSNLHLEPGRDTPRVRQLGKDVAVELFARQVVPVAPAKVPPATQVSEQEPPGGQNPSEQPAEGRKEDWWLIRATLPDKTSQSGWILGRFIDLDVPAPIPDYASAADMHITAWFELNHVADSDGSTKPQFLVVGTHGGEGQACDFTMLRVFTWGNQRQRYETAYVESDLCGKLPVNLTTSKVSGGDSTFSFHDLSEGAPEIREYRMHQTIVRRVRQDGALSVRRKHG